MSTRLRAFLVVAASALAACSSPQGSTGVGNPLTSQEQSLLADGEDGRVAGETSSAIIALPLFAIAKPDAIATADTAAATSTYSIGGFFPAGCRTSTRSGNVVTFTLSGCTSGPLGLSDLSGTITATFTAGATGGVDVAIADGGDLTFNGQPVKLTDVKANVSFSTDGTQRTIHWSGRYDSTTLRGRPISHQADYVYQHDSSCVAIDGTSSTTVGARTLSTQITGYHRCGKLRVQCPSSGELVHTDGKIPLTVRITFLGGASAVVTRGDGSTVEIGLACTP